MDPDETCKLAPPKDELFSNDRYVQHCQNIAAIIAAAVRTTSPGGDAAYALRLNMVASPAIVLYLALTGAACCDSTEGQHDHDTPPPDNPP